MIADFDDFCLWVYFHGDVILQRLPPRLRRPGPTPTTCSDSELIAMAIIGECRGWELETNLLSQWSEHRNLFPRLPSQSRFNRRRRNLVPVFNAVRRQLLDALDVARDPIMLLPVEKPPPEASRFHHHGKNHACAGRRARSSTRRSPENLHRHCGI